MQSVPTFLVLLSRPFATLAIGYGLCVLLPLPWVSRFVLDRWVALAAWIRSVLHELTASAENVAQRLAGDARQGASLSAAEISAIADELAKRLAPPSAPAAVAPPAPGAI
jgi:hypothetical protein